MVKYASRKPRITRKKRTTKYRKRRSMPTAKFIRKVVNNTVLEKKRHYIAPVALTNGDITCVAPINAYRNGGLAASLTQPFALAQQFASASDFGITTNGGWASIDITPHPQQGTTFGTRNGSAINLTSSYMQFQFSQASINTLTPMRIKMVIIHTTGAPYSTANTAMTTFYLNSALPNGTGIGGNNGLIDYNSNMDMDERSNFKIIYQKSITLKQDNVDQGLQVREHKIKLKYNKGLGHKVRFFQNTQTVAEGQLIMLLTTDAGNISTQYAFTGNGNATLVNNAINSGCYVNFNIAHYFTDA